MSKQFSFLKIFCRAKILYSIIRWDYDVTHSSYSIQTIIGVFQSKLSKACKIINYEGGGGMYNIKLEKFEIKKWFEKFQ